jgi:hypothetical protein
MGDLLRPVPVGNARPWGAQQRIPDKGFQIVVFLSMFSTAREISRITGRAGKGDNEKTGAGYTNILPSEDLINAGVVYVPSVPTTFSWIRPEIL